MRALLAGAATLGVLAVTSPGAIAGTVTVPARGETVAVGTANADAADDPAIWRNPRRPAESLIVATDKKAGLYVYGLDGKVRDFVPAGRVNNVDLVDMGGKTGVIVVASDRNDKAQAKLAVYRLDIARAKLVALGAVAGGGGEAYGVCLWKQGRDLRAFSVLKHGVTQEVTLSFAGNGVAGKEGRRFALASQTEGCVVDPRSRTLYVGEEDRGIWAFDLADGAGDTPRLVAPVDRVQLFDDVEGLALAPRGKHGGWLVASSQGDNAYALYRLPGMEPAGRFRIGGGAIGSTEETDGIALATGSFGPAYPGGLFVAQDGSNAPAAQNFKLVAWKDVLKALRTSTAP